MHADGPTGPHEAGMDFETLPPSAVGPGLGLADCLDLVVEGYLFGDLDSMANEISMKEMGAVCYPMMMAVLAGSELLGGLTGGPKDGEVAYYWRNSMATANAAYGHLGQLAQDLLRNGLMHVYLTKPGIGVRRDRPEQHLTIDPMSRVRIFNCVVLADDFRRSYYEHAKARIGEHPEAAQKSLDRLLGAAAKKSAEVLARVPADAFGPMPPGTISGGTIVATGASGLP
jgi:hypothetical protein